MIKLDGNKQLMAIVKPFREMSGNLSKADIIEMSTSFIEYYEYHILELQTKSMMLLELNPSSNIGIVSEQVCKFIQAKIDYWLTYFPFLRGASNVSSPHTNEINRLHHEYFWKDIEILLALAYHVSIFAHSEMKRIEDSGEARQTSDTQNCDILPLDPIEDNEMDLSFITMPLASIESA
jgi:hypothetical protein